MHQSPRGHNLQYFIAVSGKMDWFNPMSCRVKPARPVVEDFSTIWKVIFHLAWSKSCRSFQFHKVDINKQQPRLTHLLGLQLSKQLRISTDSFGLSTKPVHSLIHSQHYTEDTVSVSVRLWVQDLQHIYACRGTGISLPTFHPTVATLSYTEEKLRIHRKASEPDVLLFKKKKKKHVTPVHPKHICQLGFHWRKSCVHHVFQYWPEQCEFWFFSLLTSSNGNHLRAYTATINNIRKNWLLTRFFKLIWRHATERTNLLGTLNHLPQVFSPCHLNT